MRPYSLSSKGGWGLELRTSVGVWSCGICVNVLLDQDVYKCGLPREQERHWGGGVGRMLMVKSGIRTASRAR